MAAHPGRAPRFPLALHVGRHRWSGRAHQTPAGGAGLHLLRDVLLPVGADEPRRRPAHHQLLLRVARRHLFRCIRGGRRLGPRAGRPTRSRHPGPLGRPRPPAAVRRVSELRRPVRRRLHRRGPGACPGLRREEPRGRLPRGVAERRRVGPDDARQDPAGSALGRDLHRVPPTPVLLPLKAWLTNSSPGRPRGG